MLSIDVIICTIDEGIRGVPESLAPKPERGVKYVVSMQYTDEAYLQQVPDELRARKDVHLVFLKGRGLARNRNYALTKTTADIVLIADDDVVLHPQAFDRIRRVYSANPRVDVALFRFTDYSGRLLDKHYPKHPTPFVQALASGYYPCSWEITMRGIVHEQGVLFNEHFGLGADYLTSGEEDIFLHDVCQAGFNVVCYPQVIGATDPATTGLRLFEDVGVQRAKGAVFAYCYGSAKAYWRSLKEALHHFLFKGRNPIPLFVHFVQGIRYVVRSHTHL